ncbi:hypothetical protein J6590_039267 [Homalodisca vitripennis]|nr:hypothetical protein J6590_039267 [Homalodisca vitripennis]
MGRKPPSYSGLTWEKHYSIVGKEGQLATEGQPITDTAVRINYLFLEIIDYLQMIDARQLATERRPITGTNVRIHYLNDTDD